MNPENKAFKEIRLLETPPPQYNFQKRMRIIVCEAFECMRVYIYPSPIRSFYSRHMKFSF